MSFMRIELVIMLLLLSALEIVHFHKGYAENDDFSDTTDMFSRQGNKFFDECMYHKDKYNEALKCFDTELAIHKDFVPLKKETLRLLTFEKDDEAIKFYDVAQAVDSDKVGQLLNRGRDLEQNGYFEDALKSYDAALAIDPDNVQMLFNRADLTLNIGRPEEALKSYDKVLVIEPHNSKALSIKGNILIYLGKYDEAIVYIDKALSIDPKNVEALYYKGNILIYLGKYDEAIGYINKALAIDPDNVDALNNKGVHSYLSWEI